MREKIIRFIQSVSIIFTASIITMSFSYIAFGRADKVSTRDIFALLIFSIIVIIFQKLFFKESTEKKRAFDVRLIIHFLFIEAAILGIGWILDWYDSFINFIIIFGFVALTFLLMHLFFHLQDMKVSNEINQKLAEMREKEKK
ncbi:DUF3021 family protein [Listeria seeligeri]|uniref:DUF3021 family protein n=1 Tax=Listeria seeligeri TaxID=1640 RepID=UPI0022EB30E7|nr:DUF3021 family protein [Listeria seeligeri]